MKQFTSALVLGATALIASSSAFAGEMIPCPDISQAKQISECPAEDEVKQLFRKACGFEWNAKPRGLGACNSYSKFKKGKYTALWESNDGEFMSYATCSMPASEIKNARPMSVTVSQKNGLYKVACNYQGDITFTMRTRSVCSIPGVQSSLAVIKSNCESDASQCRVECK